MKKNIAIVAGGDSGEYVISMSSARTIQNNIDPLRYSAYTILINKEKWVYVEQNGVEHSVDKNDFSINYGGVRIGFDCAFITIHGTPGEDGKLQGYFDLLGIPYTTSGLLASALTFNKYFCNQIVASWGIPVARSVKITSLQPNVASFTLQHVSLPVFVKPNKGGSSLGTSFVKDDVQLPVAIATALEHDDEVLVEEFIQGRELTCGAFKKNGVAVPLPVTEIISNTDARFFDFQAKYTAGGADEITPAQIPDSLATFIQETTKTLYEKLELKGMARIDYIYSNNTLFFLEANITPGMSETSIVPQQAVAAGMTVKELFTIVIEEAINIKQAVS